MDLKRKLTSRKFWMSVAAFLGSIGGTIAGIATDNQGIAVAGIICAVASQAIYSICEAYVDASSVALPEITVEDEYEEEEG